jgi:signal transduction histidine kinase
MYSLASQTRSSQTWTTPDLSHFFQLQLQQLSMQIPVLQARIIYWDQAKTRQIVSFCEQYRDTHWNRDGDAQRERVDELFIDPATMPLRVLTVLENHSDAIASICTFGQRNYLLLWTQTSLSSSQKSLVEQQVLLLEHYFNMHQEHLRQQSEVQLLEQILQQAEHQLRNPLALVSLYAENLYLGLSAEEQKQQVALIRETTAKLTESVSNLLACGQKAKLRINDHNLLDILQDAIADLQPWLREKEIKLCCPDLLLRVSVDCWQLQQVLHNLLHNAIQFSPLGGTITCEWQVYQGEVLLTIADQGAGLSDGDLQQIFTPFYSRRPGGTGLGLAIAKKIILDHRGSLWAENRPNGGAQFSISLPN